MRDNKKYLAVVLAATMALGSSVTALASTPSTVSQSYVSSSDVTISESNATTSSNATGTVTGNGGMEGTASPDVFSVVVPQCITSAGASSFNSFDFVLDPQGLITKTEASRYKASGTNVADSFVADKTVYFLNKTNRVIDDTSDLIKVTNKSSMDVEISLDASVTGLTDIAMSGTKTFSDKATSLYLALKDSNGETPITKQSDGSNKGVRKAVIDKAPDGSYEVIETGGNYDWQLKDDATGFTSYEFALTGACNAEGDWSAINENPSLSLTWKISPYVAPTPAAPSIATTTYTKPASGDLDIAVDLGAGNKAATDITSVTFVNNSGNTKTLTKDTDYTFDGTTLTLKAAHLTGVTAARNYTVTFDDDAPTTVVVKVTP